VAWDLLAQAIRNLRDHQQAMSDLAHELAVERDARPPASEDAEPATVDQEGP
jgi:hypothetical protein